MSNLLANTVSELKAALGLAMAGDTILLSAGVYTGVQIKSFQGDVTITSADPQHQAVLSDLLVQDSSGIKFQNLEFDRTTSTDSFAYRVESSKNISFDHLNVHGSLDNNASNDRSGILIRKSDHVSVTDSEFHELSHAIDHSGDTYLTVTGNTFHELRSDGILGSGSAHVVISANRFYNFHPDPADHPDAIQFWADAGEPTPIDLVISGNVIDRGDGGSIQGIFMSSSSGPKFTDVVIHGNQVKGGLGNGIAIFGGKNVAISDNVVTSLEVKSWIRVETSDAVNVVGNTAGTFLYKLDSNVSQSGNTATKGTVTAGTAEIATSVVTVSAAAIVAPVVSDGYGESDFNFDDFLGNWHQAAAWQPATGTATAVSAPPLTQPDMAYSLYGTPYVVFDLHDLNLGNIFL